MNNNDILRRIRYLLDIDDAEMVAIFALAGATLTEERARAIMGKEEDKHAVECRDDQLGDFLDGLIVHKRGPYDGPPRPKTELSNNEILKKLRVAFQLRHEDMLRLLAAGGHAGPDGQPIGKTELAALFRAPGHKNFRPCGNQVLRKFLVGLTQQERRKKD